MAIRDQNVLDKVNTLNTNLENANIAEVQRNISNRLFGVLEGANNISIDPELHASISNVANTSDITKFINKAKHELRRMVCVNINYGTPYPVTNSRVNLSARNGINKTQTEINNMNTAIAGLNNLPNQINRLRTRLEENHRTLNEIHNIQNVGVPGSLTNIDNNRRSLRNYKTKCRNLINILNEINRLENLPHYNNGTPEGTNAFNSRNSAVSRFSATFGNTPSFTAGSLPDGTPFGVSNFNTLTDRGDSKLVEYQELENNITNLDQEYEQQRTNRINLDRLDRQLPRLPGQRIPVPEDFGLFNTDDTIITSRLDTSVATNIEITNIANRLEQLNVLEGTIETLRTRYQDNLNRLNRILALQNLEQRMNTTYPGEMIRRRNEFLAIRNISRDNLFLGNPLYEPHLPNQSINIGGTSGPIHLGFIHGTLATGRSGTYSLCDSSGSSIRSNGGALEIQHEGQALSFRGIAFDNAAQTMTINNLSINPIEGVTFPLSLDLNVRVRIHDDATGLDIDHHKPIHLTIVRPNLGLGEREHAYDSLVPPMNDRVAAEYSNHHRENLENEVIWNILREGGNESEVNEIYNNETRRNMFIDRVRRELTGHFPLLSIANLQVGFRADMTRESRDVPTQYLLGEPEFQNYIRQNLSNNIRNYASTDIRRNANSQRNEILQTFLTFQTNIANNRVDNDNHIRALAAIPNDNPQGHANSWWQRLFGRRSNKNNYTKFFQGREQNIENQTLETENGNINYGIHVEVLGVNKITATINIEGKDEPEIIDAPNHNTLIRGILSRTATKDGQPLNRKLRCHLAIDTLKALVMMSPQRLNRQIPVTQFENAQGVNVDCDRIEAGVHGGNLIIRAGRVDLPNRTRENVTIFDESSFKNLHDITVLEYGINELSTQINLIMNASAREYEETVNNLRNKSLRKFDTKQFLRFGPVKRLRGRMAYGRTNNDFDFTTSANAGKKSVNISLSKGEFTLSGDFEGKAYEFKSKDIGVLLRKKINRKRVFDGLELAIVERANEAYIERLRTNNLVSTESFAVADLNQDKTGRIYIYDDAGNLSYLEIEDRNLNPIANGGNAGRIPSNNLPVERIRCNEMERREFFQNPFLAGRLRRVMRRRLALF